ncbi:HTH_38 domain-containing protein [Trichonephila clavipes]|nr:HTH_38 domain-containing protein [Trichonephila clavipes]
MENVKDGTHVLQSLSNEQKKYLKLNHPLPGILVSSDEAKEASQEALQKFALNGFQASEKGWSNRRIGRHLGRSDMVVARCWQQWITEGRVYRRGGSGRPRNTNDREDRAIRRVATSAPTTSLASIQRHLPPSRHPVPSRETIKETTDRSWLEEPTSAKTLTTDPTS